MSWTTIASLGLAMLQLVIKLLTMAREKQAIDEAREVEIARASLALLDLTQRGQAIRAHIVNMSTEDADKLWDDMLRKP